MKNFAAQIVPMINKQVLSSYLPPAHTSYTRPTHVLQTHTSYTLFCADEADAADTYAWSLSKTGRPRTAASVWGAPAHLNVRTFECTLECTHI